MGVLVTHSLTKITITQGNDAMLNMEEIEQNKTHTTQGHDKFKGKKIGDKSRHKMRYQNHEGQLDKSYRLLGLYLIEIHVLCLSMQSCIVTSMHSNKKFKDSTKHAPST
jgi:hypothetical protein